MNIGTFRRLGLFLLLLIAGIGAAHAQATRTWISGVGDDANPCSRTAPCKTFAGAISKTAAGGVIDVLDPGGFGGVTITKSITLENIGEVAGVLVSGTNGIVVNAAATDTIILRGLSIEGLGTGINGVNFLAGGKLQIENCTIQKFNNGINFTPSGNATLVINNSTINNNAGAGILMQGGAATTATSVTAALNNVRLVQNQNGLTNNKGVVSLSKTTISGNVGSALAAVGTSNLARINLDDSLLTDNNVGASALGSQASIFLSRSSITNNATALQVLSSSSISSFGNNRIYNNTASGPAPTPIAEQ